LNAGSKSISERVGGGDSVRKSDKNPLFTSGGERRTMLEVLTAEFSNVSGMDVFRTALTVDYACQGEGQRAVLRGIRALSDYEYELRDGDDESQTGNPELETVFMMPGGSSILI